MDPRVELLDKIDRYEEALKYIIECLGPKPPNCGCMGCSYEMGEALDAARDALGLPTPH